MNGVPPAGALAMVQQRSGASRPRSLRQALRELPRPRRPRRRREGHGDEARRMGNARMDRGDDPRPGRAGVLRARSVQGADAERRHAAEGQAGRRGVDADGKDGGREGRRSRSFWPRWATSRAIPRACIDPAVRALGEKIVSERCTTCHLYKGDGDDQGSGVAPELAGYRVHRVDARAGRQPRNAADVPRQGPRSGDEEAHAALRQRPVPGRHRRRRALDALARARSRVRCPLTGAETWRTRLRRGRGGPTM